MLKLYNHIKFFSTSNIIMKNSNIKRDLVKLSPKKSALIGAAESHDIPLKKDEFLKKCKEDLKREKKEN